MHLRGRIRTRAFASAVAVTQVLPYAVGGAIHADSAPSVCTAEVAPTPAGAPEWHQLMAQHSLCATEGTLDTATNLAATAMLAETEPGYAGDPFRDPTAGWAGTRGEYLPTSFTDSTGTRRDVLLFGPSVSRAAPGPGVIIPCYSAWAGVRTCSWYWTAELLAEAGYIVALVDTSAKLPAIATPNIDTVMGFGATGDVLQWFTSDPIHPVRGEVNPWWARVNSERIGCVGHSGNGAACLRLGRQAVVTAVVALDPAGGDGGNAMLPLLPGKIFAPRIVDVSAVPTMIQRGDYWLTDPLVPKLQPPKPYYEESDFDDIRATGADEMHVVLRAATHYDWSRPFGNSVLPYTRYGEQVASYYTLAWFDRYLVGADDDEIAADALRRLTATLFDDSSDAHSIGTGLFDPDLAASAGSVVAGNVPLTIAGMSVCSRLSFWFRSGYRLDRGALTEDDLRGSCAPTASDPGAQSTTAPSSPATDPPSSPPSPGPSRLPPTGGSPGMGRAALLLAASTLVWGLQRRSGGRPSRASTRWR